MKRDANHHPDIQPVIHQPPSFSNNNSTKMMTKLKRSLFICGLLTFVCLTEYASASSKLCPVLIPSLLFFFCVCDKFSSSSVGFARPLQSHLPSRSFLCRPNQCVRSMHVGRLLRGCNRAFPVGKSGVSTSSCD